MAYEEVLVTIGSLTASADLSSYQYCAVYLSGEFTVTYATSATAKIIGILQNKPTSGQAAEIGIAGISKARIGTSVTYGNLLTATTDGTLIPTTTATNIAVAMALETISLASTPTDTELCTVLLLGPYGFAANAS